jgi:hypothetical protein
LAANLAVDVCHRKICSYKRFYIPTDTMNLRFVDEHVEGAALVEAISNETVLDKQWHEKLQRQKSTCCLIFVSENMAL